MKASTKWLICLLAAIGFAFDIYELLMLPLIVRPALAELIGAAPGSELFQLWVGRLFFVPAIVGGIFGLLGGYLTDRFGRRLVLTASILIYAFSAFAAGFSTSVEMLLFFRCTTFIGVCVEFVAAVAWLAELFPEPRQRERVLGYTQAFSSIGGLLVAIVNGWVVANASSLWAITPPDFITSWLGQIQEPHAAWRYTLMSGLFPALPLILIRPFLPESPVWKEKKTAGQLRRPSFAELFQPGLAKTTIVTTLLFACSYGAAFGAIQQIPQIVPGLASVKEQVAGKPVPEQKRIEQSTAAHFTKVQEVGGLAGRFLLAMIVVYFVSRRALLRVFLIPGLIILPWTFLAFSQGQDVTLFSAGGFHVTSLEVGIFLCGLFTVGQFSFWGNYLPQAFPLHLRGTGESMAANIGGRMLGTSFAWITSTLAAQSWIPGTPGPVRIAVTAAGVGFFVYFVALCLSFVLPEPEETPEE